MWIQFKGSGYLKCLTDFQHHPAVTFQVGPVYQHMAFNVPHLPRFLCDTVQGHFKERNALGKKIHVLLQDGLVLISIAALTNDHKVDGLRQEALTTFCSRRLKPKKGKQRPQW